MKILIFMFMLGIPFISCLLMIMLSNKLKKKRIKKNARFGKGRKAWAKQYSRFLETQWDEYKKAYEEYLKTPESAYRPFDRIPPPAAFCY
jgi:hypothetical protein